MDLLKKTFFIKHLLGSITTVIIISIICLYLWFPSPFILLDGTWLALLILAGVDITLGPLLTLMLVSSKKSTRAILVDMTLILILQIGALTYGLMQIEQQRVVGLVHFNNAFHIVTKKDFNKDDNEEGKFPTYNDAYIAMIKDSEALNHYANSTKHILYTTELYLPIEASIINEKTFPVEKLPLEVKDKYNTGNTFKALAGKNRNAVIVLNNKMEMVEIALLPTKEE